MIWRFRLKEPASCYSTLDRAHQVNFVTTDDPNWKAWKFVNVDGGIEITPPTELCTLFVPHSNLYFVLHKNEPKAAKPKV